MLEGYPYSATDVAQAFYLYQNHFWNFIAKGKVVDLASPSFVNRAFTEPLSGEIIHIPWWKFANLKADSVPQFDIVTANHTLCEMHPNCLGFALYIAQSLLQGRGLKAFMFEGWGLDTEGHSRASVNNQFYKQNFALAHNDSQITVFVPTLGDKKYMLHCLPMNNRYKRQVLHLYKNLSFFNILKNRRQEKPLFDRSSWEPWEYKSAKNPLSGNIIRGREIIKNNKIISIDQVSRYYTELLGTENHLSPDEHFLKLASCDIYYTP